MNPACSARLCMNGADSRFCLHKLHSARGARGDFSVCHLNEDMNNISKTDLRVTSLTSPFHLSKTSVISYTHRTLKVFTATRQNKSSV